MPIIKQLRQHKVLLDTHIWIWIMLGESKLSQAFKNFINSEGSEIFVSPISIWEIGMLVQKNRLEMEMDVLDWVERSLNATKLQLFPMTPRIAIQSTRLPGEIHADPADRILIASAHEEGAVLVTCDEKIILYGKDQFVSVHNPI